MAILKHKDNDTKITIHFGDNRYQQYKDTTGLQVYTHKNHLNKQRRNRYRKRHSVYLKPGYYSAGYFSFYYLW
jgi:hypothetical protein